MITLKKYTEIVSTLFQDENIANFPLETLKQIVEKASDLYFSGKDSLMTDEQFDFLEMFVERGLMNENKDIGHKSSSNKILLPFPMGSLNQVYQGEYTKWVGKHNLGSSNIILSEKLDGVSNMIVYGSDCKFKIAYSRGDGKKGADVTRHIKPLPCVPKTVPNSHGGVVVRGETIISKENFEILVDKVFTKQKKPFKTPRNMIAGLMNNKDVNPIVFDYVDFIAYEIVNSELNKSEQLRLLDSWGFKTVFNQEYPAKGLNDEKLTKILNTLRETSQYEIDGIVIEVDNGDLRKRMVPTRDTINPEYSVKYKVGDDDNYAEPVVIDVELNVSKDGYVKPTIILEPTVLQGVTISRCTGFNMKYIIDNKIQPGCRIKLTRSGDVIPFCLGVATPGRLV